MNRSLLAAPAIAALLLAGVTGIASAAPGADCTAMQQQLSALQADLAGAIEADNEAGLTEDSPTVTGLKSQVRVTVDLVATNCAEDEPTDEPEPTGEPEPSTEAPNPTESQSPTDRPEADEGTIPLYEDCAEARDFGAAPIAEGDPGYRAELDADGDGTACEVADPDSLGNATGGDDDTLGGSDGSNSGVVDSIPSGSVDTGYVAA